MNEGDRTIAVFGEGSAAVDATLTLQDRVHAPDSPVGLDVRLRIALDVGETNLRDGVYSGSAVDRVLWLRSVARAGRDDHDAIVGRAPA